MIVQSFLEWGRLYHYPQLVLDETTGDVLHAGERSWHFLIAMGSHERIQRAKRRVQRWQEMVRQAQAEEEREVA